MPSRSNSAGLVDQPRARMRSERLFVDLDRMPILPELHHARVDRLARHRDAAIARQHDGHVVPEPSRARQAARPRHPPARRSSRTAPLPTSPSTRSADAPSRAPAYHQHHPERSPRALTARRRLTGGVRRRAARLGAMRGAALTGAAPLTRSRASRSRTRCQAARRSSESVPAPVRMSTRPVGDSRVAAMRRGNTRHVDVLWLFDRRRHARQFRRGGHGCGRLAVTDGFDARTACRSPPRILAVCRPPRRASISTRTSPAISARPSISRRPSASPAPPVSARPPCASWLSPLEPSSAAPSARRRLRAGASLRPALRSSPRLWARPRAWMRDRVSAPSESSRARRCSRRPRAPPAPAAHRAEARARSRRRAASTLRDASGDALADFFPRSTGFAPGSAGTSPSIGVRSPEYFEPISRVDCAGCFARSTRASILRRTASPRRRRASIHRKIARELTEDDRSNAGGEPFLPLSRCSFTSQQLV